MASASPRWMVRKASPMAVRGAGAGRGGGFVRSLGAVLDGDVPGGEVDDGGGDEEWGDLARAAVHQRRVFALDDVEAADAGADVDADHLGFFRRDLRPECCMASCAAAMAKWMKRPILRASFFSTKTCGSKSLTSAAKRTEWPVEIECRDLSHATLTRQQAVPDLRCGIADPAKEAHALLQRHDDATACSIFVVR